MRAVASAPCVRGRYHRCAQHSIDAAPAQKQQPHDRRTCLSCGRPTWRTITAASCIQSDAIRRIQIAFYRLTSSGNEYPKIVARNAPTVVCATWKVGLSHVSDCQIWAAVICWWPSPAQFRNDERRCLGTATYWLLEIPGSDSADYKDYCHLRCDAV
jgi:hypothetical protein